MAAGIKDVKTLSGKRIVTSFPSVCKTFFDQHDTPDNPTSEDVWMYGCLCGWLMRERPVGL